MAGAGVVMPAFLEAVLIAEEALCFTLRTGLTQGRGTDDRTDNDWDQQQTQKGGAALFFAAAAALCRLRSEPACCSLGSSRALRDRERAETGDRQHSRDAAGK
jgi:hypothetical protein